MLSGTDDWNVYMGCQQVVTELSASLVFPKNDTKTFFTSEVNIEKPSKNVEGFNLRS